MSAMQEEVERAIDEFVDAVVDCPQAYRAAISLRQRIIPLAVKMDRAAQIPVAPHTPPAGQCTRCKAWIRSTCEACSEKASRQRKERNLKRSALELVGTG